MLQKRERKQYSEFSNTTPIRNKNKKAGKQPSLTVEVVIAGGDEEGLGEGVGVLEQPGLVAGLQEHGRVVVHVLHHHLHHDRIPRTRRKMKIEVFLESILFSIIIIIILFVVTNLNV